MNVVAILQARMGSSRLPGKVLKPIMGRPMLELQLERIRRCQKIDQIVVATSVDPDDDPIVNLCEYLEIASFRGDQENVLDRIYQAAKHYDVDHVVRLTGDCPLTDPVIIDDLISHYFNKKCDYASNCLEATFPDGLDAEVFSFDILEQSWKEASLPSHLEHVTQFIIFHPERFKQSSYKHHTDLSDLRWTVDEPEDFEFAKRVYELLYPTKPEFGIDDVLTLIQQTPNLAEMNKQFERNTGLIKSREKDKP